MCGSGIIFTVDLHKQNETAYNHNVIEVYLEGDKTPILCRW